MTRSIIVQIAILVLFARIESVLLVPYNIDHYPIISEVQVIDSINWFIEIDISQFLPYLRDVSIPCSTSIFYLSKGIDSGEYKTKMYLNSDGFGIITQSNIIGDSIFKIYNVKNTFELHLHKDTLNGIWKMCIDSLPPNQSLCVYNYYSPLQSSQYFCYARCTKPSIGSANVPSDYLSNIAGRIKDVSGNPVPNIVVSIMSYGPKIYAPEYLIGCSEFGESSRSDSAGRFDMHYFIAGYYIVSASFSIDNMHYYEDSLALINLEPADSINTEISLRHYQYLVSNKKKYHSVNQINKSKISIIEIPDKKALRISFTNPFDMPLSYAICIYDMRSRLISEIYQPVMKAGTYSIDWDGKNKKGNGISAGRYICRISDGANTSTTNFVILK